MSRGKKRDQAGERGGREREGEGVREGESERSRRLEREREREIERGGVLREIDGVRA